MASAYPGGLDSFTNPVSTDLTNSVTVPHATQHADNNDAIEAVQAELGVDPAGASATVVARLDLMDVRNTGYTTTATAAGTTTLTASSNHTQFFTGVTTQTVVLPVTSTLVLGDKFRVVNNSTGVVTVQSSGANTIYAQAAKTEAEYTVILTSGTDENSWSAEYSGFKVITGTGSNVLATSPTLVTPTLGVATATKVNLVTITQPATAATLTLAEGSSLITAGAYATTLTATATTGVTLPTSGTLATLAGSEAFTNKTLTAPAINSPVIVETVTNAITAHVGSSQGDGAITTKYARVTTSANPDDAVTLPAAVAGKMMVVNNSAAANAIDVFPATNGYINALAQNAAFNLAANKTAAFFCMVDGTWVSILTA
jgi:hypothetical protein